VNAWRSIGVADQFGRRVVVTGANTGLGYQTSLALASAGADVVMAVRDLDRGQAAAQSIRQQIEDAKLRVIHLDWRIWPRSATSPNPRQRRDHWICW